MAPVNQQDVVADIPGTIPLKTLLDDARAFLYSLYLLSKHHSSQLSDESTSINTRGNLNQLINSLPFVFVNDNQSKAGKWRKVISCCFWLERWNLVSLCVQHRRCGVVRQCLLTLWARLKLTSWHFGGKNNEIKRAATVQAVAIFSVPRLEWSGEWPLFELDSNKRWGPKCGHYSSYPLGYYWSQAWGPWP